jgi:hypothetical protein
MTPVELLSLISRLEGLAESAWLTTKTKADFIALVSDRTTIKTLCSELRARIEREQSVSKMLFGTASGVFYQKDTTP